VRRYIPPATTVTATMETASTNTSAHLAAAAIHPATTITVTAAAVTAVAPAAIAEAKPNGRNSLGVTAATAGRLEAPGPFCSISRGKMRVRL
jgi:hypothetical protein